MDFEKIIRKQIIQEIDYLFESHAEHNFNMLNGNEEDVSDEEADKIESIFMSYRNVVAGTEWDGEKREYEKYKVK